MKIYISSCKHNWSFWSKLVNCSGGIYQYRYCLKCNIIEKRRVGSSIEFVTSEWNHSYDKKESEENK